MRLKIPELRLQCLTLHKLILAIDVNVCDASVSYRSRGQQKFEFATEPFV